MAIESTEAIDLDVLNRRMEPNTPLKRIEFCLEVFGDHLVLSSSFGIQSAVMLHMATQIAPEMPIIFVDTGYHFTETYRFVEELKQRLQLNLHVYQPLMTAARQEALFGKRWEKGLHSLEAYNQMNKVEPMNRALRELNARAWLTGLRREQSHNRAMLNYIQLQGKTYKIHPILEWTNKEIHQYLTQHDLPYHPLWEKGYVSIGDWHSTKPLQPGMQENETRFDGLKRECGLHENSGQLNWQI